jgi:hypothetical protein
LITLWATVVVSLVLSEVPGHSRYQVINARNGNLPPTHVQQPISRPCNPITGDAVDGLIMLAETNVIYVSSRLGKVASIEQV